MFDLYRFGPHAAQIGAAAVAATSWRAEAAAAAATIPKGAATHTYLCIQGGK